MKKLSAVVRAIIGVIFPLMAYAQSAPPSARPDPLDAKASVPSLHYESAIGAYRPMDDKPTPAKTWRSANDLVRDTGSMSSMSMGGESGEMSDMGPDTMKNMDHGAMKGMDMGGMEMKKSKPERSKPAKQNPSRQDSMPGMDMSSGTHNMHGKEMP